MGDKVDFPAAEPKKTRKDEVVDAVAEALGKSQPKEPEESGQARTLADTIAVLKNDLSMSKKEIVDLLGIVVRIEIR